ncbi:DUF2155 domain-containing protein [Altererythrobacter lutimaris]|uniref:DUF2155 domain-containing protein n=1 Tax=Altererythrobacter lutimaris TaxID=2743979 RepID=A0A850HDH8_9SPHN|nr:DUF2155 domain-containing protein [Altererythrobacter lutimaris]NVE95680.1 DUF2155 domain-containing protein [Altererythrobacter lutimaris]
MTRAFALSGFTALAALTLSACSEDTAEPDPEVAEDAEQSAAAPAEDEAPEQLSEQVAGATPMEERVATLGLINKRNNVSQDLELRPGESQEIGPVIVRLSACERTAPWEMPQETGAFVQVDVQNRGSDEFSRVFSGWLFKNSPSVNVVEHPIYDVWVKDCAMNFPGEE